MIEKTRLKKLFSRAARYYDKESFLQQEIGQRLLTFIQEPFSRGIILDVGMGTGIFTQKVKHLFSQSKIIGMDISWEMLRFSSKDRSDFFLQADAEDLPFRDCCFDMVISNLAYQWIFDKSKAFKEVFRILKEGGRFYLSCFTHQTLKEIRETFSKVLDGKYDVFLAERFLLKEEKIKSLIKTAGFKILKSNLYLRKQYFLNLSALLHWLKKIGSNYLSSPPFIGLKTWRRLDTFYQKNFSQNTNVFASFEVLELEAKK